jgi:Rrf2 family iron-sulfur cluster assembly transcriptional regulator
MHITTAGHHAVRIMVDLALHSNNAPVLRQDISDRLLISPDYIAQLFRRLHKASLIDSVMGPGGGYALARGATDIRVGDIVRAVEGPIETRYCVAPGPNGECPRKETCTTHFLWSQLSIVIDNFLNGFTLQYLCDRSSTLNHLAFLDLESSKKAIDMVLPTCNTEERDLV